MPDNPAAIMLAICEAYVEALVEQWPLMPTSERNAVWAKMPGAALAAETRNPEAAAWWAVADAR